MSQTLRLHYAPDNASLCVRLALEELDVSYETVLVDRAANAQKSQQFLALNPNGLIPVLETSHGPMFETGAILLWLADTYKELMPLASDPERVHSLQWLFWLSNTLHPTQRMLFYPTQYIDSDVEALRLTTRRKIREKLDLLDNASHADWLDADEPSIMGCYLGPLLRWCALYGGGIDQAGLQRWPRLSAFAKRAEQRTATRRAALVEGLGPTPFSNPHHCNPPEGSAT